MQKRLLSAKSKQRLHINFSPSKISTVLSETKMSKLLLVLSCLAAFVALSVAESKFKKLQPKTGCPLDDVFKCEQEIEGMNDPLSNFCIKIVSLFRCMESVLEC